ncbi:unnamed protein product [Chilo suppressalis]|uniref:SAM-dependent MTase RsmB/NOP-type domain-containing protein n=1 Tax=Chilo suppressalis TaxID=168631 RepID=A0ABN8AUD6_CHISP|nr:unnamed protein product [Chilo suppressalis]
MENLQNWLSLPPKYTTFRINRLKSFNSDILKDFLTTQTNELHTSVIPNFYFLNLDCLVLERWPEDSLDVTVEYQGKEIIVDALCAAAVLRGANVFAPGVVGLPVNCNLNEKVKIYGDLEGHCKRGLKIAYTGKKLFVGTGLLKMLRYELFDNGVQPSGIAVQTIMPISRLPVINEAIYPEGVLVLQNLPSIVCGWVVDARPNEYILDMCAAPGNKTTHLAEMSNDEAIIIALDKTPQKIVKIKENCSKQGVQCVKAYSFDSTKCFSSNSTGINGSPPYPSHSFDKVLLDAPCSGLGQRPQLMNKMTPKMLESYKFVQRKLMSAAVQVLKSGGRLIYSTCTVTVDENEGMVLWALEKFPCLKLVRADPLHGSPGLQGCGLSDEQRMMVQRFSPEIDPLRPTEPIYRDTIGFFIATFTKI